MGRKHLSGLSSQAVPVHTETGSHGANGIASPEEPRGLAGRE